MEGTLKITELGYELYLDHMPLKTIPDAVYPHDITKQRLNVENCNQLFGLEGEIPKGTFPSNSYWNGYKNGFRDAVKARPKLSEEVIDYNFQGLRACIEDQDIAEFYISLAKTVFCELYPKEIRVIVETNGPVNGYKDQPDNVIGFIASPESYQLKKDNNWCLILKRAE